MKYAVCLALWNKDNQTKMSFANDIETAYEIAYELIEIIAPSRVGEVTIIDTQTGGVVEKMNVEWEEG